MTYLSLHDQSQSERRRLGDCIVKRVDVVVVMVCLHLDHDVTVLVCRRGRRHRSAAARRHPRGRRARPAVGQLDRRALGRRLAGRRERRRRYGLHRVGAARTRRGRCFAARRFVSQLPMSSPSVYAQ